MNLLSQYATAASILSTQSLTEGTLSSLEQIFGHTLILGALDLLDRSNVLKYNAPARHYYHVFGSTSSYQVFLDLPSPQSAYCTCPAFAYLIPDSPHMCKHVLAVLLGRQIGRIVDRPLTNEELAPILLQEYS
ncbi:SWIM-type domain-containing protein [Mycena chlorophos]|uniref:SWIM-type domain-containing protein n=1 Tax=Mycena chlorophos TaxID=658473 RepID=A0A8H6SGA0_MYCCL|nr:SWIM-type domain-containing protein [Mycena chlorophos]